MRKILTALALAGTISAFTAGTALAAAHQVGQTQVTQSGNSLTISASIAGLGNVPSATFNLEGTVDVFSQCYNRGGKNPAADNKQEEILVNSTATFPVRNGRTNVSFNITPLSTLDCPGSQVVVVESFTYDLTIVGEGVTIPVSGSG